MNFKYWRKTGSELRSLQIAYIKRIHDFAASRGLPRLHSVYSYQFDDLNDNLMYETLLDKLTSRINAYRWRDEMLAAQESKPQKVRAWKTFWRAKKQQIDWTRGNWRRFFKPDRYYRWRKMQYKNRFHNRPITYISGGRFHNYKLDPYDFKKKWYYNEYSSLYDKNEL